MRTIWVAAILIGVGCKSGDNARSYADKSKRTEAQLQMKKLSKDLAMASIENAAFPIGKAGPKPAVDCCKGPNAMCPAELDWDADPTWRALRFQVEEPSRFRYSYDSDGKTATARAIGDLDCDGVMITFELHVSTAGTQIKSTLTEPAPDAD